MKINCLRYKIIHRELFTYRRLTMNLFESAEDYLEAILVLSQKGPVHAVHIANHLNFTKASVSIAMKKLEQNGYITIDELHHIHLTDSGMKVATNIYEKHTTLTKCFVKLGVDPEIAAEDACKMEHIISEETFEAIKKHIND